MSGIISAENGKLGGRPIGSRSRLTILKEKKRIKVETAILQMAEKLVGSQAMVALGTHRMLRPIKVGDKIDYQTVTDIKEIDKLLKTGKHNIDYIIVVGNEPDWKAGNALLDRPLGKATETIKHEGEVNFSLRSLAEHRKELPKDNETIKVIAHDLQSPPENVNQDEPQVI